MAFTGTITDLH